MQRRVAVTAVIAVTVAGVWMLQRHLVQGPDLAAGEVAQPAASNAKRLVVEAAGPSSNRPAPPVANAAPQPTSAPTPRPVVEASPQARPAAAGLPPGGPPPAAPNETAKATPPAQVPGPLGFKAPTPAKSPIAVYASRQGTLPPGEDVEVSVIVVAPSDATLSKVAVFGNRGVKASKSSDLRASRGQPGRYKVGFSVRADEAVAGQVTLAVTWEQGGIERVSPYSFPFAASGATLRVHPTGNIVPSEGGGKVHVQPASSR